MARLLLSQDDDTLQITFCDVGQGDAILISRRMQQMLIDGGSSVSVIDCLEKQMPFWDKTLEVMVATHPDSDHIGGLSNVLESYIVPLIITNQQTKETADFDRFQQAVTRQVATGGNHLIGSEEFHFMLDNNVDVSILNPSYDQAQSVSWVSQKSETLLSAVETQSVPADTDYNNQSVVMMVSFNQLDILLTGDLETSGEQALLRKNLINEVEVLKVGHHGAKTSTSPEFIAKTSPEISVISVGKNNRYGHPNAEVITQLEESGSLILRTDQVSTFTLSSDGRTIWRDQPLSVLRLKVLIANWLKNLVFFKTQTKTGSRF